MNFRLLGPALDDLDQIDAYLSERFGNSVSLKAQGKLFDTFALLTKHPGIGITRSDVTTHPVRFFSTGHNWIIYAPGSPTLIHRIFPAVRDIERLKL